MESCFIHADQVCFRKFSEGKKHLKHTLSTVFSSIKSIVWSTFDVLFGFAIMLHNCDTVPILPKGNSDSCHMIVSR